MDFFDLIFQNVYLVNGFLKPVKHALQLQFSINESMVDFKVIPYNC